MLGAVCILLYDTSTAIFAQFYGIRYDSFALGSSLICIIFGFFAARSSGLLLAGMIGAFIGAVESSIGWYISWTIGPGNPGTEASVGLIGVVVIVVTAESAFFGLVGGFLGWIERRYIKKLPEI